MALSLATVYAMGKCTPASHGRHTARAMVCWRGGTEEQTSEPRDQTVTADRADARVARASFLPKVAYGRVCTRAANAKLRRSRLGEGRARRRRAAAPQCHSLYEAPYPLD